jgi:hypothetical protein
VKRRLVAVALVGAVALALSACGGGSGEGGLDANPAPIDPELVGALPDGVDPLMVPEVQRNFIERCVFGKDDLLPDRPAVQQQGLIEVCGCTYDAVAAKVRGEAAVDLGTDSSAEAISRQAAALLDDLDEQARIDGAALSADVQRLAAQCIRSAALITG